MQRLWLLLPLFAVAILAAVPGGVVIEGTLHSTPTPGSTTPVDIRIQKGGLDYFGRLLIQAPEDCRLAAADLHGGQFRWDERQHVAIISWLKLPDAPQFDLQLDLIVEPNAAPRHESLSWEFSFIRNNDRESVRPTPLLFDIASGSADQEATELDAPSPGVVTARRTWSGLDAEWEASIELNGLRPGGFVKLEFPLPPRCRVEIMEDAGSTVRRESGFLTFLWFDYQYSGWVRYKVVECSLSQAQKSSGTLSFVDGDATVELPVIESDSESFRPEVEETPGVQSTDIQFEVQIAALKNRRVTDYFDRQLDFRQEVREERLGDWVKYTHGVFTDYWEARDHRNNLSGAYNFQDAFVVGRREGKRISTQEALTRTGQKWIP